MLKNNFLHLVEDLIVMSVRVDTPECGQIVSRKIWL